MVSDAQEELQQCLAQNATGNPKIIHATERRAGGITQAVGHFKLGPNLFPIDIQDFKGYNLENVNPDHEVLKFYLFYEKRRRPEVDNSECTWQV
ncbi:hypothetical protein FEM48_Zijuj12G0074500 [Ziziphus jujuba var. spinosa]|uniref:Sucrose phosphatase-like domain-containing protein n=1 Tax=Ziziphus jujuba var. spinosa TaxID=714518 RepID=A0A978UBZ2_ZIZJJ|nr:hypothetical protein FEM48_Zijuj12G0074500 [Ziziphus jujuba var. spinosa]